MNMCCNIEELSQLTVLDLSHNVIDDNGFIKLSQNLDKMSVLETLNISSIAI